MTLSIFTKEHTAIINLTACPIPLFLFFDFVNWLSLNTFSLKPNTPTPPKGRSKTLDLQHSFGFRELPMKENDFVFPWSLILL